MTAASTPSRLTDAQFRALTDTVLASVEATLDRWLDEDRVDIDAQRSGGLLEMRLPQGGHVVLNTQAPLHQLWLAARSGGFHFCHVDGQWLDTRNGREFFAVLSACVSEQAGTDLRFPPPGT